MEEVLNGEQLEKETAGESDATVQKENMALENEKPSSPIQKFKSLESLEKAYINLEKEFTKKCQELKTLKQINSDNAEVKQNADEQQNITAPQLDLQSWEEKVKDFFEKNPQAKTFSKQISEILSSEQSINEQSLEKAFEKVKLDNFKTKQEMIQDESFISEYVLNNEEIKQRIIKEYLSNIMQNKKVALISSNDGSSVMVSPKNKPKSLKEAGDYMLSIISGK